MEYAKIIVKNNYEHRGDLVLRSYVRAIKKIGINELLDGDNAIIYGMVDEHGTFYELFTKNVIDYDNYINIPMSEYVDICFMDTEKKKLLKKVIEKVLFNQKNDLDIEISDMHELALDRAIEFDAYNNLLSRVNPYQRLASLEESDCNNFQNKLKEIKIIRMRDSFHIEPDEYEVKEYQERPISDEEDEYLVFEVPREDKPKTLRK